jgi:hypothetical protein
MGVPRDASFFLLLVLATFTAATLTAPPQWSSGYSLDAFYVEPTAGANNLAAMLAKHKIVRLGAFDYSTSDPSNPRAPPMPNITLTSGMVVDFRQMLSLEDVIGSHACSLEGHSHSLLLFQRKLPASKH